MKAKKIFILVLETIALTSIMLFSIFPFSCRVSVSGLELIGSGCPVPVLENFTILDSENLSISFSDEIYLTSSSITSDNNTTDLQLDPYISYSEDKKTICAHFPKATEIGKPYIFTGLVKNNNGSSLTFSFPFTGYNDNVPKLLMTETMDEPKTIKLNSKEYTIYEFVEFYALSDGNLAGLQVYSTYDGEKSEYNFPSIQVKKGDFITLHYRKTRGDENNCIDEISGAIKESTSPGSADSSWDLWVPNDEARLGKSQDIIILKNTQDGSILQALLYSNSGKTEWTKDKLESEAELCIDSNVWGPESSVEYAAGNFTAYPNFTRINLPELILQNDADELSWPPLSNCDEWKRFPKSQSTPGYWKDML